MRLIAIETSTIACSAALRIGEEVRERFEIAPRRHADLLLPMIDSLLGEAGIGLRDLDAVAFARGPGAFTGLRIAAGAAQGIAFGAGLPVVPVSTLAALAQGALRELGATRVLTAMDARMQEVYWGTWEAEGGIVQMREPECVCAPEAVGLADGTGWFGVGDGWSAYGQTLAGRIGAALRGSDPARYPRAMDVAVLAAHAFGRSGGLDPSQAVPVYLRDRVAETLEERAKHREEDA